jgi:VanZ family protein
MVKKSSSFSLRWVNAWLPPFLWAAIIFLLSSQGVLPSFTEVFHDFIFKKLAHITVYAVLYYLFYRAVGLTLLRDSIEDRWKVALSLCFVYAISDELHQMFVPGRYGTIRDIGYDMLGAGIILLRQYQYI